MSEVDLSDFIKASNKFHEKKASWEGLNKEFIDELKEDTDRLLGFYFYGGMFMATHKIQKLQSDYDQLKQSAENSISQVNGEKAGLEIALKEIEQMSDCGSYELSIVRMKAIATKALKGGLTDKEEGG